MVDSDGGFANLWLRIIGRFRVTRFDFCQILTRDSCIKMINFPSNLRLVRKLIENTAHEVFDLSFSSVFQKIISMQGKKNCYFNID